MESLFRLKDQKHNFHLIAFQFHTLDYSLGVLKNKKKELRNDPILKHKIDNYLLMERLSISQKLNGEVLPFDINANIKDYLNNPSNADLKNYMNLCQHIIARELDMADLCSKIDFQDNLFVLEGNDLYCTNNSLSTVTLGFNDIEKNFLCSCARRSKRIVNSGVVGGNTNYNQLYVATNKNDSNNLLHAV